MSTKYEMWLTYDGEKEKLQLPVLPEEITIREDVRLQGEEISGGDEIIIKQGGKAADVAIASFFPSSYFQGCAYADLPDPNTAIGMIRKWKSSNKPVHFIFTGGINKYFYIEKLSVAEEGGDPGTLYYTLSLKEYKEVSVRKIKVEQNKASAPKKPSRPDNNVNPRTVTVKTGDCLWNLAVKYYGSGGRWQTIYDANRKVIGSNPNLIYPGQVLAIP